MSFVRRFATKCFDAGQTVLLSTLLLATGLIPAALANEPKNWQLGFQPSATPVKERLASLHDGILVVITLITLFVLGLLIYVIVRFNAKSNPVPSKTSHNTMIEVAWTVIPVMILIGIAIPSFKLMYYMDKAQDAEMTIKVTGHQWYWSYEYPDHGKFTFDSTMIPEADAVKNGLKRLLDVDNKLVIPAGTTIRVLVAGSDVMHSWFVPSFGVQTYSVVGRLNEAWMKVDKEGVYYGQCNQICGVNHAFMPIAIEVVSKDAFAKWTEEAKKKYARNDTPTMTLAAAPQN